MRGHTGSCGVIRAHVEACGVMWKHAGSCGVIRGHAVSYGLMRCHTVSRVFTTPLRTTMVIQFKIFSNALCSSLVPLIFDLSF